MARHRHRGRPKGAIGFRGYTHKLMRAEPELGDVYRKYATPSKIKQIVKAEVKREIKVRGRPESTAQSMQIIGGHLRVKLAKSRVIRVAGKEVKV